MRRTLATACCPVLFACALIGPAQEDPAVARVGERTLSLAELDERARQTLFDERTRGSASRVYDLRAEVLDAWVEELVLRAEAERRGVSVEALIEAQTPAVSDAEIAAFFEGNRSEMRDNASLEEFAESIRSHLELQGLEKAVWSLIDGASVAILLEPPRIEVAATGPAKGPPDAPVTIVEFSDFQCRFCRQAGPVIRELLRRYPERVRVVYRHLPLDAIHPRARAAAEASGCAADQGHFWEFHDRVFEAPQAVEDADLRDHAQALGLSLEAYDGCVASGTHTASVTADVEAAREAGISSTPAFVINGALLVGAQPLEAFERLIERELRTSRAAP